MTAVRQEGSRVWRRNEEEEEQQPCAAGTLSVSDSGCRSESDTLPAASDDVIPTEFAMMSSADRQLHC